MKPDNQNDKEKTIEMEYPDNSRRKFMLAGALGVAGFATSLNASETEKAKTDSKKSDKKRVTILVDTQTQIPMKRLGKPEEAAHFVATLIDGKGTFQTAQIFSIDGD